MLINNTLNNYYLLVDKLYLVFNYMNGLSRFRAAFYRLYKPIIIYPLIYLIISHVKLIITHIFFTKRVG